MPKLPFHRKPSAHGPSSLFRNLFPRTRARARERLSKFRHETLSSLRHRAQSRIYKYIIYRQALRLKKKPGLLQRLRLSTRRLTGSNYLEHEARRRRHEIAQHTQSQGISQSKMSYQDDYEPRESGGRRRKLAGYLKAANELRQSYTAQYAPNWKNEQNYKFEDDSPAGFADAAVVRSGKEELILFPSYARKHIKRKPEAEPGTIQESEGEGRDVRDSVGAGDAEFWKQQWQNYEDDNAVVDVDVRGWIYSPFKGQMSRKQRLFIGLARQLVGVQAPAAGSGDTTSPANSRDPSPGQSSFREGHQSRQAQQDEMIASREAEEILRRGEKEAAVAAKGGYSEKPSRGDSDDTQLYRTQSRDSVRTLGSTKGGQLSHATSRNSLTDEDSLTAMQKRASWNQPADMTTSELAEANTRLMARLKHFLAVPMANTPISIFFYNDNISKQRTVYTDAAGHFSVSAALDFVPTHVRILASDHLSATEEVLITDSNGISVISDIDDTIKHSAISSGAREIFRNAFIRELSDLTITGVQDWYNAMFRMGVKFHYVSNSPWQLFPVISKYFELAGLPPGSFHLKQYSGMLQGIFEPVAERKKVTLDKIARDFPERDFILIGDSGEADLEVYTDFVLENPGRVIAVFIRDVTTSEQSGFFDPSIGPMSGGRSRSSSPGTNADKSQVNKQARPRSEEHDPELKAAIAASLREMGDEKSRRSKSLFPELGDDHPELRPKLPDRKPSSNTSASTSRPDAIPNLIDLSPDEDVNKPSPLRRVNTDTQTETLRHRNSTASTSSTRSAPPRPRKPQGLRSPSGDSTTVNTQSPTASRPPPPPKPRRLSNTSIQPSPLSQQTPASRATSSSRPAVAPKPDFTGSRTSSSADSEQSYAGMAKDKLWSVYNSLPALRSQDDSDSSQTATSHHGRREPPPPAPPRRRDGAASAVQYVGTKASNAWQHAPSMPHYSRPQVTSAQTTQDFSTSSPQQRLNRTNTGSTLGANGAAGGGDGGQYLNKREQLWHERWYKAQEILHSKGVLLKSWRLGTDAMAEAERVIRESERRWKK